MLSKHAFFKKKYLSLATALILSGGASLTAMAQGRSNHHRNNLNAIVGVDDNIRDFLSANRGTNGGGDQRMQHGDEISGTEQNDVLIGALGIYILFGDGGDDIIIGGTEDFMSNVDGDSDGSDNRDKAIGGRCSVETCCTTFDSGKNKRGIRSFYGHPIVDSENQTVQQ